MMENVVLETRDEVKALSLRERASAYFELTKPRIAFMLVLTSAAGFYMASGDAFDWKLFLHAMFGITLLAFGVATLNQYVERETDALMERTAKRPLPSGRLNDIEALVFGGLLCIAAELYLGFMVNGLTALLGIVVIVGYVLVYTPLKRVTSASTAIGAIPGAMPPLMGWTAASDEITVGALALFVILFLWQFPHFLAIAWMYKDEYAKAGIKMLPVVEPEGKITARQIVIFTIMLIPMSLAPYFLGISGLIYLIGAVILGLWFLRASVKAAHARSVLQARKLMFASVLYLPLIYGLMVLKY